MFATFAILTACLLTPHVQADRSSEWNRFRGPNGSGVVENERPPVEVGPGKNLLWKKPLPEGQSSPIAAGNLIVLTGYESGRLYTIAFDKKSGKIAWKTDVRALQVERFQRDSASPATATPAFDGIRIVCYFPGTGLIAYDLRGKELWRFGLPVADIYGDYGSGVSPIIAGGLVVLVRDTTRGSAVMAVRVDTGKLAWKTNRLSKVSWCTPAIWRSAGRPEIVSGGHGAMTAYDLGTGAEKWVVRHMPSGCTSSPFVGGDVLFFAGWSPGASGDASSRQPTFDSMLTSMDNNKDGGLTKSEAGAALGSFFDNYDLDRDGTITRAEYDDLIKLLDEGKNGVYAVKAGGSGDITDSHMIWKRNRGMGYVPTGIHFRGQVIMVKDGGIVTALNAADGELLYVERLGAPGEYHASPVAAGGHVYFASLQGVVTVMQVGAGGHKVVWTSPKLDGKIAATPAIAGNTLFVRTSKSLYAFAAR